MKPKILVTAAAGKTDTATTMQLLEKGYPIRALVNRLMGQRGTEITSLTVRYWP